MVCMLYFNVIGFLCFFFFIFFIIHFFFFFFSSRRRHTRSLRDWSSDVCSSDLLLFLESENPDKDIHLYINSPGGIITSGLSILDTMRFIKPDVSTLCIGQAASMGAVLLAAGKKGKRFALPHARVMIHQPSGGAQGQATDIEIQAREILYMRERLNKVMAEATGQPVEDRKST